MSVGIQESYGVPASGETPAEVLARLPRTWHVFADVARPGRGNATVDQVLVGPQGVFVIEAQEVVGEVGVRAGVVLKNGRRHPRATAGVLRSVKALSRLLPGLDAESVQPVLCITGSRPVSGRAGRVLVCSTGNLIDEVTAGPAILSAVTVHRVASLLGPLPLPLVAPRPATGAQPGTHDRCQPGSGGSSPHR